MKGHMISVQFVLSSYLVGSLEQLSPKFRGMKKRQIYPEIFMKGIEYFVAEREAEKAKQTAFTQTTKGKT